MLVSLIKSTVLKINEHAKHQLHVVARMRKGDFRLKSQPESPRSDIGVRVQ